MQDVVAELFVQLVVAAADDKPSVARLIRVIGRNRSVGIAHPLGVFMADFIPLISVLQRCDNRVDQRNVNPLSDAGHMPRLDCRQNADCQIEPAQYIADCRTDTGRAVAGVAGDRHQAAHCLGNDIIAGALGIASVAAKSRDSRIDQPGIQLFQLFISKSQLVHDAGAVVFQYNVSFGGELAENFLSFLALEV